MAIFVVITADLSLNHGSVMDVSDFILEKHRETALSTDAVCVIDCIIKN